MANLTPITIAALKPSNKRREIPDGKTKGLYLVVQPGKEDEQPRMSWAFRYRINGKAAKFTIGPYTDKELSLANARRKAERLLGQVADGIDPAEQKMEIRRAAEAAEKADRDLVENIIPTFIERHAKKNTSDSSWEQAERLLNKELLGKLKKKKAGEKEEPGPWLGRSVQSITKRDVLDLLDGLVDRGAPVQANRVLAHTRKMFNWLVERDVLKANPCAGLKAPKAETSRDRVLSDDEVKQVWKAAEAIAWPFGPFVKLLILTGQRREEVGGMRRSEVDFDKALWVIPKERAKNGVAHEVPLSAAAVEILEKLPKVKNEKGVAVYMLSTTGETSISGYARAKERLDEEILKALRKSASEAGNDPDKVEAPERWTLHDLRRTAASGMGRLGVQLPTIEKILNHVSGSFGGIVGVYQRHSFSDEKRAALETWGRFIEQLVTDKPADNVVPIRGAK